MNTNARSTGPRPTTVAITAGAFALAFALGLYAPGFSESGRQWWADIGWTAASLWAAIACWRTAQYCDRDVQRAWQLFALGCTMWFAGMLIWDYLELVLRIATPFPALSDVGFLAQAPLFALGLIRYRAGRTTVTLTLQGLSDFGLIVCATIFCAVLILYNPLITPGGGLLYKTTAIAYPALFISTAMYSLFVMLSHVWRRSRSVIVLITLSLVLHGYTDTLYAYAMLIHTYRAGAYMNVFWIISFGLIAWAAAEQRGFSVGMPTPRSADNATHLKEHTRDLEAVLPVGTLIIMAVVIVSFHENLNRHTLLLASPFVALYLGFLTAREWATHVIQQQLIGQARKSEEQMRASERELSAILDSMQDTYYRTDPTGKIQHTSASVYALLGYRPEELAGNEAASLYVDPETHHHFRKMLSMRDGHVENFEAAFRHRDGGVVWVLVNGQYIRDANGEIVGVEGTARNVTARKIVEVERHKLSSALQQTADAVVITDPEGIIEYVNPAYETITGFSRTEAIGRKANLVKSGNHDDEFYQRLWQTIRAGEIFSDVFINRRKDGSLYYEAKTITPLKDEHGSIGNFISTGKDITEQMQTQEKLHFMAHHDALTGLPNRVLFLGRVQQALARAQWHRRLVALMFLDLDRFKTINDSLGHDVGDRLLGDIAKRLGEGVRDGDTVARFGGDEFVILLDDIASESDVTLLAERVLELLDPPFLIEQQELHVTASIGISLFPEDGTDSQTLMRNADIAMYRAKDIGRNNFAFYSNEMSARVFEHLALENNLRHALEREQFELYYQPQVDVAQQKVIGIEALLRWHHPELGLVSPGDFVPLLEETGLIVPVGEWVLRQACCQLVQWAELASPPLRMAVNLSARQFNEPRLQEQIERIVSDCGIQPAMLELEMTESVFMRQTETITQTLGALHAMGMRLAIDDFGTGYSSLNYLKRFPIDTLKIDRSFIRDIVADPDDAALTAAIVAMARSLSLEVVAEGVETDAQVGFLHAHGCHCMQGYLFSAPIAAADMPGWLTRFENTLQGRASEQEPSLD